MSEWFFSKDGVGLLDPELFQVAGCHALLIVRIGTNSGKHPYLKSPLLPSLGYMVGDRHTSVNWLDSWLREITILPHGDRNSVSYVRNGQRKWERVFSFLGQFNRTGTRVMLSKSAVDRYQKVKTAKKVWREVEHIEWECNGWVLANVGDCLGPIFPFHDYAEARRPENKTDMISECYFDNNAEHSSRKLVAQQWLEVFGQPLIPFEPNERRDQLQSAYALLEPYMAAFREVAAAQP